MFSKNKLVLYNFEWQALRTSLDFSTLILTEKSLQKCREYLGKYNDINKVWRVLNLLSATRMGFSGNSKLIKSPQKLKDLQKKDQLVLEERERLSQVYSKLKQTQELSPDSEQKIKKDLINAKEEDFIRVYKSLKGRYEKSGKSKHRPELKWYLNLMEKISG